MARRFPTRFGLGAFSWGMLRFLQRHLSACGLPRCSWATSSVGLRPSTLLLWRRLSAFGLPLGTLQYLAVAKKRLLRRLHIREVGKIRLLRLITHS